MRRLASLFVVSSLLALVPSPAGATSESVDMVYPRAFSPVTESADFQGIDFAWHNTTNTSLYPETHTATADAPFPVFDTGNVAPGASSVFINMNYAGTFGYHCMYHPVQMQGRVRVPLEVLPTSGSPATVFDINPAQAPAPTGFVYEVWARRGIGDWERIFRGTDDLFTDQFQRGMWKLRGRMTKGPRRNRKFSGWSPQFPLPIT